MFHCPLGTPAEASLRSFVIDLSGEGQSFLKCNTFQGRGSSLHPPFFAFEIGFEQKTYDYDQLISRIEGLFYSVKKSKKIIDNILLSNDVRATFVMNFNCQNSEQKPVFDLNNEQLKLLGDIGASLSLDTYFEF
ncbi:hypothetical protein BGP75_04255 [Motiliproteus sp. MSK22-1]|nr:hypothetical protein BGP75_04255 [Motiliproteus sp. MSK22-1]